MKVTRRGFLIAFSAAIATGASGFMLPSGGVPKDRHPDTEYFAGSWIAENASPKELAMEAESRATAFVRAARRDNVRFGRIRTEKTWIPERRAWQVSSVAEAWKL